MYSLHSVHGSYNGCCHFLSDTTPQQLMSLRTPFLSVLQRINKRGNFKGQPSAGFPHLACSPRSSQSVRRTSIDSRLCRVRLSAEADPFRPSGGGVCRLSACNTALGSCCQWSSWRTVCEVLGRKATRNVRFC